MLKKFLNAEMKMVKSQFVPETPEVRKKQRKKKEEKEK
jgi:hypothetical protein